MATVKQQQTAPPKGIKTFVNKTHAWTNFMQINRKDVGTPKIDKETGYFWIEPFLDVTPYESFASDAEVFFIIHATGRPWVTRQLKVGVWGKVSTEHKKHGYDLHLIDETLISAPETFRIDVKVTNPNGTIAGLAENIRTEEGEAEEFNLDMLSAQVDFNLGDRLWEVEFRGETRPILLVSSKLSGGAQRINQPELRASVLSGAVDKILTFIANTIDDEEDVIDDPDSWQGMWLRWAKDFGGEMPGTEVGEEDRSGWINDVVRTWCNAPACRFVDKIKEE